MRSVRRLAVLFAVALLTLFGVTITSASAAVNVLRVGSWHGIPGQFSSIQAAVNAAQPGDWILVGPGDYHESPGSEVGVTISTPDVHLRGMDRNRVVLDGTLPGAPQPCDSALQWQNFGPATAQYGFGSWIRSRAS